MRLANENCCRLWLDPWVRVLKYDEVLLGSPKASLENERQRHFPNEPGKATIPGGQAANAPLRYTPGLAVDSAGNLYAADSDNAVVVKLAPDGSAATVAGNGIQGYSGDGDAAMTCLSRFAPLP